MKGRTSAVIFRSCFTDVEELLGKPVQAELSAETGLDVALDALVDLANGKRIKRETKKKSNFRRRIICHVY